MNDLERKWKMICKPIPTYVLSDQIGLDTETAYVLDLGTEEKFNIANEYLNGVCTAFVPIEKKNIGKKVIMEMDTNGGDAGLWYEIHGDIDEYLERARETLTDYMRDIKWGGMRYAKANCKMETYW